MLATLTMPDWFGAPLSTPVRALACLAWAGSAVWLLVDARRGAGSRAS